MTSADTSAQPAVPCVQQEIFDATGVKLRKALEVLDVTEEDPQLLDNGRFSVNTTPEALR